VVGTSSNSNGNRAFLYSDGQMQDLGTLPGDSYISYDININDLGQVVGTSSSSNSARAFLYSSGQMQDLGTLPGDSYSQANEINDLGQVVGTSGSSNGERVFLYSGSGALQDLGTLSGDSYSRPTDINNSGQVVGVSAASRLSGDSMGGTFTYSNSGQRAFLYSSGVMTDLNALIPTRPWLDFNPCTSHQ
jgi:probable HAF family extracellular repeat protein